MLSFLLLNIINDIKYYSSVIIFICMTMIICIDANIIFNYAFAISSFPRSEFAEFYSPCDFYGYDPKSPKIDFDCLKSPDMEKVSNLPLPVDITDITYFSNGEIFNATLWLNSPLYDNKYSDYVEANLSFITTIYKIERPSNEPLKPTNTIPLKPTNTIYVYPERDGNWTYKFFEIHPDEGTPE